MGIGERVRAVHLSQYCSGAPTDINGNFDPSNSYSPTSPDQNFSPNPVPNTLCSLQLSGARTARSLNDTITANARTVQDAVTNGSTTVTSGTSSTGSSPPPARCPCTWPSTGPPAPPRSPA